MRLLLAHRGRVPFGALAGAPAWTLTGGVVGCAYVVLTRLLGTALAVSLVIAAQVSAGLLLDHYGALGLRRRPLNATRITALLLVLVALGLRVLR